MKWFRFAMPALTAVLVSCGEAPTAAIPAPEGGARHGWTVWVDVWCPPVMYVGDNNACTATGWDDDGHMTYTTGDSWHSNNPYAVYVNAVGGIWAYEPGTATVSAYVDGVLGSTNVRVDYWPVFTSVTVSPTPTTVYLGGTRQLTATAKDQYGAAMSGYSFSWSSSNTAVATVSSSGVVSAVSAGSATITATSGAKSGSASVTVSAAPPSTSVSGPSSLQRYQSAQFTASTSGGSAPYTYQWRTRTGSNWSWNAWQSYYSTGSTASTYASTGSCGVSRMEVEVKVTDANAGTATGSKIVTISNPC
jgi:hypothetical protein